MSPRSWHWLRTLIAAAMALWAVSANADPKHLFVVIVPTWRPPTPPPPAIQAPAPLLWYPPPPLGLTPGTRSPNARCYVGTSVCPLARPERVGESCTCGSIVGRALIPPSHDASGRPLRTD
jgi:hypothetical protein